MNRPIAENEYGWTIATLTQEQHKQIQKLEDHLGIVLIAYMDADRVDLDTAAPKSS